MCVIAEGSGERARERLASAGLADHVATLVTTQGVGGEKESGAPYTAIREQVAAERYVMIGDDYAADVEAARAAGFVPIHYDDTGPDFFRTLDALL